MNQKFPDLMDSSHRKLTPVVQLFAKPPIPGKVKTRLIPELGDSIATAIYRYCLDYTLKLVYQSGIDYQLWLSEKPQDSFFEDKPYHLQQGEDIGSRMLSAIDSQFQEDTSDSSVVILIGSDCLDLTAAHLRQAIEALHNHDLVLLPTFDGGYALIGCRKIDARLFDYVEWGQNQVLNQTLKNAKFLEYRVCLLETVRDIDRLQDVNHYYELRSLISGN
jgi:rSAM/selenodomain-associated transferase 1